MSDFEQKLIENPSFLKWIFNTDLAIDHYWEQYMLDYPEEKDRLLDLKNRLTELKFENTKLNVFERNELEQRIKSRLGQELQPKKSMLWLYSFMKYAAIAFIFAGIGGVTIYLNTNNESIDLKQAEQLVNIPSSSQGPLLITSGGKNIQLKKSSSSVDYTQKGEIVLNNDSIIRHSDEEENKLNQLVIPYGNQSRVVLSDNTVVWLNSGSRLIYPSHFSGKTREVLLYGEAFFEVSKNAEKPFIVQTTDLEIRVLGTQFNVSAYDEDNVIQTVLKEGSVSIRSNNENFFEKSIIIKPNELASFDKKKGDTKIYKVDAGYYTLWTKGLISFDEIDFSSIIKKVERYYNISISFSDSKMENIRFSGKLDLKQGRNETMEYLEKVSESKFEKIDEKQYVIK